MKYENHITPGKIADHWKVEDAEAKEEEIRKAAIRKVEEKEAAIASQLSPAVETSITVWPALYPLVKEKTRSSFNIIASHIDGDFICAGSFPAASLASVWTANSDSTEPLELLFNDIDVYHGAFGEGKI